MALPILNDDTLLMQPEPARWRGLVRLWEAGTGRPLHALGGHGDTVFTVAFSPDGTRLASATASQADVASIKVGEVKVWDVAAGTEVLDLKGHRAAVSRVVLLLSPSPASGGRRRPPLACRSTPFRGARDRPCGSRRRSSS